MDEKKYLIIDAEELEDLLNVLKEMGYKLMGPTLSENAVVYSEINGVKDLPIGFGDEQKPGSYRLVERGDEMVFGYTSGIYSWRRFLYPPTRRLYRLRRSGRGRFEIEPGKINGVKLALIGVRACELKALKILDRVLIEGEYADPYYKSMREKNFILAVNCTEPGGTCFCASMGTGPRVQDGFDLALTELLGEGHRFMIEVGSQIGWNVVNRISYRDASEQEIAEVDALIKKAEESMGRKFKLDKLDEFLQEKLEDPIWEEVAKKCLMCGNCTQVCPTCFCTTVEDYTNLRGDEAWRVKRWDSCFTLDFSYIVGGPIRKTPKSRYRQWFMHKFSNWVKQFGDYGCVGCGRCITWCPVGIDVTEIISRLRGVDKS